LTILLPRVYWNGWPPLKEEKHIWIFSYFVTFLLMLNCCLKIKVSSLLNQKRFYFWLVHFLLYSWQSYSFTKQPQKVTTVKLHYRNIFSNWLLLMLLRLTKYLNWCKIFIKDILYPIKIVDPFIAIKYITKILMQDVYHIPRFYLIFILL